MKTQALKGMRDLLPNEQTLRDYIQGKILETYRASGFERISTPMLEDMENLDKSDGGDNLNLIFKVLKRGDKLTAALNSGDPKELSDMGLRYDLTLPLSRFYAANKDKLPHPFKVIQTDRVFRAERPQKGRLREFVQYIDSNKESLINDVIHLNTERQGIPVEVALTYNNTYNENVYSFVNNINTIEGGTHLTGFRRGLTSTLKKYAEDNKMLEKVKVDIASDDFREGLTAVVSVKVMEPQFEGQTKTKLGNNEVIGAVQTAVSEALRNYLEENPRQARTIVEKVIIAAQARHAAYNARVKIQRKSPLSGGGLPGKLADCSSRTAEDCELFIVEGDSAGGTAKQGRDRTFQAILPLRGKILNVEKAMDHKIFDNQEITNLFKAMRVTIGTEDDPKAVNLSKLAYHKIIIMTDADVDGSHIATLLMTFFFRRMRPVIENGYLYLATPPLYRCTRGKVQEYCWTDQQVQQFILKNGDKTKVQRYKGLGEMSAEELRDTTMAPEHRMLKKVEINDAAQADRVFSMLMGEDVDPRREFIESNANYANIDA